MKFEFSKNYRKSPQTHGFFCEPKLGKFTVRMVFSRANPTNSTSFDSLDHIDVFTTISVGKRGTTFRDIHQNVAPTSDYIRGTFQSPFISKLIISRHSNGDTLSRASQNILRQKFLPDLKIFFQ